MARFHNDRRLGMRHASGEHAQYGWRRIEVGVARHQQRRHFQRFQFGPRDFHVVAVLGGLGNMYGALVGGLLIGLVQSWAGQYLSGTWVNAISFLVLIIVLIFRPNGLVGKAFYAARVEI